MPEYRDVVTFRPRGNDKPFAQKIGSARVNDDGTIDIYFDALPVPNTNRKGDIQIHARISPRQQDGRGGGQRRREEPRGRQDDLDDDVPF